MAFICFKAYNVSRKKYFEDNYYLGALEESHLSAQGGY
jgi:hypothetical protein